MVILSKLPIEQFQILTTMTPAAAVLPCNIIPTIDLSKPDPKTLVKACEELGFFKVINHGVSMDSISTLEAEAVKFFSLTSSDKEMASSPNPFGYRNKKIGCSGDIGWVEYLLMNANPNPDFIGHNPQTLSTALSDYLSEVRTMACHLVELMAEGLRIQPIDVFSRLFMDEQSDSLFRINHYPPCPQLQAFQDDNTSLVGFGEHTDPQIISVLRSNNTSGFEISLRDGNWVSVPPDRNSFFINVGDSLQVMTNGRFRSVKHRVLTNGSKSRLSMIYFGGPPMGEKIAPLPCLMGVDQASLYKEFTWFEYKKSAYASRLAVNRLEHFQKIAA